MKISDAMVDALNRQMNAEFQAFYLYLAMASYFDGLHLDGFSSWFHAQSREEQEHAMKLFRYIEERDATPRLLDLAAPPEEWESPRAAVAHFLRQEEEVSAAIDTLVEQAGRENDHATGIFLQWYVQEQVEEEAVATTLLRKLDMLSQAPNGLYLLDRELARRGAQHG